jgi:hypothetical protein
MNQILTLELSEQVFAVIHLQAQAMGISPERLVATLLERQFTQVFNLLLGESERNAARARFERHFGTLELNDSIDVDNESIDSDLVREYASTHENE